MLMGGGGMMLVNTLHALLTCFRCGRSRGCWSLLLCRDLQLLKVVRERL